MNFCRNLIPLFVLVLGSMTSAETIFVFGEEVHPVTQPVIRNGVVVVKDGKIQAVGPASMVSDQKADRVVRAAVVVPGFVDARATVGLTGQFNHEHDQDHLDTSEAIQPELRAIDVFLGAPAADVGGRRRVFRAAGFSGYPRVSRGDPGVRRGDPGVLSGDRRVRDSLMIWDVSGFRLEPGSSWILSRGHVGHGFGDGAVRPGGTLVDPFVPPGLHNTIHLVVFRGPPGHHHNH